MIHVCLSLKILICERRPTLAAAGARNQMKTCSKMVTMRIKMMTRAILAAGWTNAGLERVVEHDDADERGDVCGALERHEAPEHLEEVVGDGVDALRHVVPKRNAASELARQSGKRNHPPLEMCVPPS